MMGAANPRSVAMGNEPSSHVEVAFTEEDARTRADAVLELGGKRFHGQGQARRAPGDPDLPVVGEELATARALSDLSHQLIHAAAERIEDFEGHPVNLRA